MVGSAVVEASNEAAGFVGIIGSIIRAICAIAARERTTYSPLNFMNEIIIPEDEINAQHEWDARFEATENWTGDAQRTLSQEARGDITRTRELLGPVVEKMTRDQAKEVAGFYAGKVKGLRSCFQERLQGERAMEMLDAYFIGPVFGFNIYAEGTSGVAKTWTMEQLSSVLNFPFSKLHARSDSSDAELVGEERLVRQAGGGNDIAFAPGVVTKPGVCGVLIDEFPRLPARSSNSCLQAMEGKWVRVPLNSQQRPDHQTKLSPHFSFVACGNPAGYVGQGERNRALYDRFAIAIEVVRPNDDDTKSMYEQRDSTVRPTRDLANFSEFPFRMAKVAARFATFVTAAAGQPLADQYDQLLAASAAVSPAEYLRQTGWAGNQQQTDRDIFTPTLERFSKGFRTNGLRGKLDQLMALRKRVNENLIEGSNPRGELQVLDVARTLRLLDDEVRNRFTVGPEHLRKAFVMANLVRLKPYPGCESQVRPIVEEAANIFFF